MSEQQQMKRDVLWNAVGSLVYALASMVLAFIVIRIAGEDEGGIFGFGFSTLGQQMFIIAYFGIRPFHITDTAVEYSFGDYLQLRWLTCGAAVTSAAIYVGVMLLDGSYTIHKSSILVLLSLYKIVDGFADVFESELQRKNQLFRTGQSLTFRTLLSVFVLVSVLGMTKNLFAASLAAMAAQLLGLYCFAIRVLKRAPEVRWKPQRRHMLALGRNTVFLFLSAFLDFYIFSAAKYAVDAQLSNADSGFYNILFMPTSFIYLLANFMIRPLLTRLAEQHQRRDEKAFEKTCRMMQLGVAGLGVVIMLGALLLGRWGLGIFELLLGSAYEGRLTGELTAFWLIIAGGGLYALANVQYYILVTVRRQRLIFMVYGLACVMAWFLAPVFVEAGGLTGASLCYLILMGMLFVGFWAGRRFLCVRQWM